MKSSRKEFAAEKILLLLFLFLAIKPVLAQSEVEKIHDLMQTYHDYGVFNGSVLVAENGKVLYKDGFGMANMEWDIPNTPDTKFRLGSVTKQFTAALILQLVEEGKLQLHEPISTYLPSYPKDKAETITIHELLTHSSGIPNYTAFPGFMENDSRDPYSPEDFVKKFADSSLQFKPGEKFSYSNSGYFLLGYIIEKVTGKPYEEVLQERILDPLDMNDTGYDHSATILKKRASGYDKRGTGYRNTPYLDMSIPYAAGSLYSTVEDLYKWDQALYDDKILSEESKKLMFKPYMNTGNGSYAYGWHISHLPLETSKDSLLVIGHSGGINGFSSLITRIPRDKDLIVLLNNTGGTNLNEMTLKIKNILYGENYEMPKRSVAMAVYKTLEDEGMEAAQKRFNEIKDRQDHALREDEMNSLGYMLLRSGKTQEAIEIFKLNVQEFPDSWNVYDSLGEAYMTAGNTQLAIENYEKSVEMNPQNTNGKDILEQLKAKAE